MQLRHTLQRSMLFVLVLLLVPGLLPAPATGSQPAPAPQEMRTLEIDDYFAIERLGDPRISPDGTQVAYTVTVEDLAKNRSRTRIWMVGTDGADPIPMTLESESASRPRFSPDGRYLSFLSARDGGDTQVWALHRRGGEAIRLTDVEGGVRSYEWSPDGRRLALVVRDPEPADEDDGDDEGEDDDDEAADVPDPWVVDRLQVKRDYVGYLDHRRTHIYVFDVATEEVTQITSGDYDDSDPAWAPDGSAIAFVSNRTEDPDANYDTDIWLVDPDNDDMGASLAQVTTTPGSDSSPVFSPDGSRIAYLTITRPEAIGYAQNQVAVTAPEASSEPAVLTSDLDRNPVDVGFSPDGASVWFLSTTTASASSPPSR